jgi:hypothetical protein
MTVATLFLKEGDFHVAPFALVDLFEVGVVVLNEGTQVGSQCDHAAFVDLQIEQFHEFADLCAGAAVLAHLVRRVAEDEIITAILRRGSGTDLEDVGTDGLGLGQKAGLFVQNFAPRLSASRPMEPVPQNRSATTISSSIPLV